MAKKKKSKNSNTKKTKFSAELTGLILLLISIIGIGVFGPVGALIKEFAIFLAGTSWAIVIILTFIVGLYMILKRECPKFFTSRLVGFYLLFVSWLCLSHMNYLEEGLKFTETMQATIDNFMTTINDSSFLNLSNMGGGIIGAITSFGITSLFDVKGSYIVLAVICLFGIILLLDISFGELIDKIKNLFSKIKLLKETEEDEEDEDEEDSNDNSELDKVVVTSVEDLKNYHKDVQEEIPAVLGSKNDKVKSNYHLPSLNILNPIKKKGKVNSTEFLTNNKQNLERVLNDFQIVGKVVEIHEGPAVTQFEVEIKAGTKVSRITSINKEIALALAARDIRIEAPIPGKSTVGIEIPNRQVNSVAIREVLENIPKNMEDSKILVSLGKDIMGRNCCADLSKMPHLLVAGSTGSGKSVCINSFIASILLLKRPDEVKLVLVDPKKVELSNYNGVPHLLCPVVTDPKKANIALQKIVLEMERRYEKFSETGVKNIGGYNNWVLKQNEKAGTEVEKLLPYIVVIIDELADLMLVAAKEVEDSIMRITQMARAAGIHLIVATQRPSTDVITGVVKANIPSRIAFAVASGIDSRTILDSTGAEKLLGKGDMLYLPMGENNPIRIQGNFISDEEIERLINYVSKEQVASYDNSITEAAPSHMAGDGMEKEEYDDPLYNEIVDFAISTGKISASLIQRRFRLGYNRAARIIDLLEERGIIGPPNGSKPREVLVKISNDEEDNE